MGRISYLFLIASPCCRISRRSSLISLAIFSPKGCELAERAFREDMAVEAQLLEGLSENEREQLARLLSRLWQVVHTRLAGDVPTQDPDVV